MTAIRTYQTAGILLGLVGGLVISFDVPVIRAAGTDPWLLLAARSLVPLPLYLVIWRYFRRFHGTPQNPFANITWVQVGIIYGLSQICFTTSVFNTSAANLVFILAFNPLLAAVLSWWLIGEKPKLSTWIAIAATMAGVAIIVGGGLQAGTWFGDFFALGAAVTLALALTLSRKSGADMSLAPGLGGLISAAYVLPMVITHYSPPESWGWLIVNGALLVPIAAICLAMAPRFIPAPQAAIFYLLETVLAPLWVWWFFGEKMTRETMAGGAIVLAAIAGHTLWKLRRPGPRVKQVELPA
ncbi:DMT family transporter [Salaquimonas pukyongi]|uniref:DMT family transporter n=1 Tax=Salaquimonas pukyongi TaxID=2712698 RepID=UPI00096BA201|nr:DMT family transporter [Salaquimonas pukyongi]